MVGATGYRSDVWLGTQVIDAGPGLAGSPSVTLNADNTVEVVATGMDGVMYSLRQTALDNALPVSSFGDWQAMPALAGGVTFAGSPTIANIDGDALRDVVVLGSDGNFRVSSQISGTTAYGPWTTRYGAGQLLSGSPATVRRTENNTSELVFRATDGSLRFTSFSLTTQTWAGAWSSYAGSWTGSPALFTTASNRLLCT